MAIRVYQTDRDFQQEAIAYVAVCFYEVACRLISDGNIAEAEEFALFDLIEIARFKSFDIATLNAIGIYANGVQEENDVMRVSFGKGR